MEINVTVETGEYRLITSGTLITCDNEPICMTVEIAEEKTICVVLHFHQEKHPEGKSIERCIAEDGTVDDWYIYESDNGEYGRTVRPVPVICFQDDDEMKTLFLQIHTQKLSAEGRVKLEYCWFEGEVLNPGIGIC